MIWWFDYQGQRLIIESCNMKPLLITYLKCHTFQVSHRFNFTGKFESSGDDVFFLIR